MGIAWLTQPMTFFNSIRTVFRKYAEFAGRATRPEFWWFTLFSALVTSALGMLNVNTSNVSVVGATLVGSTVMLGSSLAGLWSVVVLLPSLALAVRRLRDAGQEWTQLFWLLLPIAGVIVLIVRFAEPSAPVSNVPVAAPAAPTAS